MLLSQLKMRSRDRMPNGWRNTMLKWVSAAIELKSREIQPILLSVFISVIVNSHVPLPVCSGVDLCALSLWLKPYPCNRPLRVGLTCGRSRFRLCSALPVCCRSGEMPAHDQHNRIPTGMFDSFFPFPAFGKKGIVI